MLELPTGPPKPYARVTSRAPSSSRGMHGKTVASNGRRTGRPGSSSAGGWTDSRRGSAAAVLGVVLRLLDEGGRRADEAHLALDPVPELRQLVEPGAAKDAARLRDARVVLDDAERVVGELRRELERVLHHRPVLEHPEG